MAGNRAKRFGNGLAGIDRGAKQAPDDARNGGIGVSGDLSRAMVAEWNGDKTDAPQRDWKQERIGADPPAILPSLQRINALRTNMAERVGFEPTWIVMTPTDFESVPL